MSSCQGRFSLVLSLRQDWTTSDEPKQVSSAYVPGRGWSLLLSFPRASQQLTLIPCLILFSVSMLVRKKDHKMPNHQYIFLSSVNPTSFESNSISHPLLIPCFQSYTTFYSSHLNDSPLERTPLVRIPTVFCSFYARG